jgi:putative hydrolase of the HAD superfamily
MALLLFDLDETLVVEEPAAVAAFRATAEHAATALPDAQLDAAALATGARARARELWHASPTHGYCRRIGISSWEGLWCRYEGELGEAPALRDWAPTYRREAWRRALHDQGVEDTELAEALGERFGAERRARHEAFEDARPVLEQLAAEGHRLAVISNGMVCLQREKLAGAGLTGHFELILVSAEVGAGKPDPAIFRCALERLGAPGEAAVMVGDSFHKDIAGAVGAGIGAVWLNRRGETHPDPASGIPSIAGLAALPGLLAEPPGLLAEPPGRLAEPRGRFAEPPGGVSSSGRSRRTRETAR